MIMRRYVGALAATMIAAGAAHSQGRGGYGGGYGGFGGRGQQTSPPATPVWTDFKLSPTKTIALDFRNASADAVLQYFSQASGIAIVKDPALKDPITLQTPKAQKLADAFGLLNAVLGLHNFSLQKDDTGKFLVVRATGQGGRGGNAAADAEAMRRRFADLGAGGGGGGQDNNPTLEYYKIKYASATQVARIINDVFAVQANPNLAALAAIQAAQGQQGGTDQNNNGGNNNGGNNNGGNNRRGRGGGGGFQGGGGGRGGRGGGGAGGAGGGTSGVGSATVKASADDYSNSVIVNAPSRLQSEVEDMILNIDKQTDQPEVSRVYPLKYAVANDVVAIVQNVLVSNAPRGKGGATTSNVPIDQRFQQAARLGGAQAAFGTVVAEARTNSLVVTATAENQVLVGQVIQQLDKQVPYVDTSFVYTLQNASALQVAYVLQQTFQNRGSSSTNLLGGNRTLSSAPTVSNNNNTIQGSTTSTGLGNTRNMAPRTTSLDTGTKAQGINGGLGLSAEAQLEATAIDQFGGGGFGGGFGGGGQNRGGGGSTTTTTYNTGQDANGQLVNVRDASGNLTVIPDINSNSIIVVTPPQNRAMVEAVLKQLDQIPAQVMIETLIVEANLSDTQKFGIEWSLGGANTHPFGDKNATNQTSQSFGDAAASTTQPTGFKYTLTGTQYSAFLQAVQTDTQFEVLSTPRIFTSNNITAQINISQSLPYVTSTTQDSITGATLFNYSFLDVGIVLTVTPRITSNGYVTMDVTQTANELQGYDTTINAPIVNQREASTTVSVKDSETVVLGGIIQNSTAKTVNKIPILGDLPLLGNLFRDNNTVKAKTELLIFLTPHVVRNQDDAKRLREDTEKEINPVTLRSLLDQHPGLRYNSTAAPGAAPGLPVPTAIPLTIPPSPGSPGGNTPSTPVTTPPVVNLPGLPVAPPTNPGLPVPVLPTPPPATPPTTPPTTTPGVVTSPTPPSQVILGSPTVTVQTLPPSQSVPPITPAAPVATPTTP